MLKNVMTFEDSAKKDILELFNKTIDADGYIVEAEDVSQKVLAPDGEELRIEDFAGIRKGSEIFVKSDIISLIKLADVL